MTRRALPPLVTWGAAGAAVAALCTASTGSASANDAAGTEPAGPVITSLSAGQVVSGQIEVTATSDASYLLIAWERDAELEWPVPVTDGRAVSWLSTSGYAGPAQIVARECTADDVCDGAQTSLTVVVSNPPPTFADWAWWDEWRHAEPTFWLTDEGDWAWYAAYVDGEYMPAATNEPYLTAARALDDGIHTVQVARCTEPPDRLPILEPPVCDEANMSEKRSFVVRTALHLEITAFRPRRISPNGDTVKDSAAVTVSVETQQYVHWRLLHGSDVVVYGGVAERDPGPYTFEVDGITADGRPLPSGEYTLRVDTFTMSDPAIDDRLLAAETSTTLTVDRKAPTVDDASAAPQVFYPRRDGFRDRVQLTGTLSERSSRLTIQLARDGKVRRRLRLGAQPAGPFTASWGGRDRDRRLLPYGTYRYRFVVSDRHGNEATRRGGLLEMRRGR